VIGPWPWEVLGIALAILELATPAFLFLPMGLAAGVIALLLIFFPGLPWVWQVALFASLSLASVLVGRTWLRRNPTPSDEPTLNRRGQRYVGRVFTLDAPIVNGVGKIRVDDSTWKITGPDTPGGVRVRVVGVDGTELRVEAADDRGGT
jgi:membrane protein implicated in regulation of membrane protease activity